MEGGVGQVLGVDEGGDHGAPGGIDHGRIGADARMAQLLDPGFKLLPAPKVAEDPLKFKDGKRYRARRAAGLCGACGKVKSTTSRCPHCAAALSRARYDTDDSGLGGRGVWGQPPATLGDIAAELGVADGDMRIRYKSFQLPPPKPPGKKLAGDPAAQVKELVRLLHEEAKVI